MSYQQLTASHSATRTNIGDKFCAVIVRCTNFLTFLSLMRRKKGGLNI